MPQRLLFTYCDSLQRIMMEICYQIFFFLMVALQQSSWSDLKLEAWNECSITSLTVPRVSYSTETSYSFRLKLVSIQMNPLCGLPCIERLWISLWSDDRLTSLCVLVNSFAKTVSMVWGIWAYRLQPASFLPSSLYAFCNTEQNVTF